MPMTRLVPVLCLSPSVAAGVLLWLVPSEGWYQWLLLAMVAPPAYLLLSAAGEFFGFAYSRLPGIRHANEFVERRTKEQSISGLRILWYLVSALVFVALVAAVTWVVRAHS